MSYTSEPIFFRKPIPGVQMYQPTEAVDCFVVRSALFGVGEFGKRGIYHAGILFRSADREWAFELILADFGTLIPVIVDGAVELHNYITLGYYPPLDAHLWRSYWTETSAKVCTISPSQYQDLVKYVLTDFGPTYPTYVPFGLFGKPQAVLAGPTGQTEVQTTHVYTVDNTCDKLPMHCFEWLSETHGVQMAPFPVTRIAIQTPTPPVRMSPTDPALLTHALELEALKGEIAMISHKSYIGIIPLFFSLKAAGAGLFRYVLSLDPVTAAQSYYRLPKQDVTVAITDIFLKVGVTPANALPSAAALFADSAPAAPGSPDQPAVPAQPGLRPPLPGCRSLQWCRRDTAIVSAIAAAFVLFAILFGCIYGCGRRRRY